VSNITKRLVAHFGTVEALSERSNVRVEYLVGLMDGTAQISDIVLYKLMEIEEGIEK
jgi:hypothetical protein